MKRKIRKLNAWHKEQVVKLDWVAGALARSESLKKNLGNATDYDDLKQVALWGVCAAVYDWTPDGGKAISSYAWDRAFAYIGHYMRDKSRMIKIPRKVQKLYYNWCDLKNKNPNIEEEEILVTLECSQKELQEAKRVGVSTPFQLFSETLQPEMEEYKDEDNFDKLQAMKFLASKLSDDELELCLKYFDGTLKKKSDIEKAANIAISVKIDLENYGFTIDKLDDE